MRMIFSANRVKEASIMDFASKEYLPDSQSRIDRLRRIIQARPVAILAAGPSIQELEARIGRLRGADICYFGINNFFVQEAHILKQINKHCSVVSCSGREGIPEAMDGIIDFLNRDQDNMFISSFRRDAFGLLGGGFKLERFLHQYDWKLLFFSLKAAFPAPSRDCPLHFIESNTLLVLIQLALIGKASSIMLFGADGHGEERSKGYYYRQQEYVLEKHPGLDLSLMNDTMHYFNPLAAAAIKNTCRTYGLDLVNILNCSKNSAYSPFPRISYDEAFDYLIRGKRIIGKWDLRTPVEPKAPNRYALIMRKAWNFCRRHRWNSPRVMAGRLGLKGNDAKSA